MKLHINENQLQTIFKESERGWPEEVCGFVVGLAQNGKREAIEVIPCQNIQNLLHQKDPERYPRNAKTAYTIDPKEMNRIQKEAVEKGFEIISIFHSHPEHGVYFSDEDKGMAAPFGEPLFPNLSYLVVSVYGKKVKNASEFFWDGKDFVEFKIL